MDMLIKVVGAVVVSLAIIALGSAMGAYPVKWLVNYLFTPSLLTAIFGTARIGFLQALALNFVCASLFKSSSSSSDKK